MNVIVIVNVGKSELLSSSKMPEDCRFSRYRSQAKANIHRPRMFNVSAGDIPDTA